MRYEWHLALRYFRGKRNGSRFLSFIKTMAIVGVTIGSAGLLIALSIVHGFKSVIQNKVVGFAPHITVGTYGPDPLYRSDTLSTYLQRFPNITDIQPVNEGQVMIQSPQFATGTLMKGVPADAPHSNIRQYIIDGAYDLSADSAGLPGIIIGKRLARDLQVSVDNVVTTYVVDGVPSPFNRPDIKQFRVNGIYSTGIDRFDDVFVIAERRQVQDLLKMPGAHATNMEIMVDQPEHIQATADSINKALLYPYLVRSLYDRYRNIFAWIDLQEQTIPLVIAVMIIVAAFNLIGTVLMMVLERTRDIGILKTLGASAKSIRRIFLLEGIFVAVVGLVFGIGLSTLFNWVQATYQLIPLSEQNYYMSYAPVEPHLLDFGLVAIVTFALCALASWLPARIAAKTDPIQVLSFGR
jgi:lipoprotein-releasing system permease protein